MLFIKPFLQTNSMDPLFALAFENFEKVFKYYLNTTDSLVSLVSLFSARQWDWSQILTPTSFRWNVGTTPMSDFSLIPLAWTLYFSTILFLKFYMKDRLAYKLQNLTTIHNLFLSIGSALMWVAGFIGAWQTYNVKVTAHL